VDSDRHKAGRSIGKYLRASGGLVSQIASSATNFLVTLVVARGGNLAELGTFSLVFLLITTLIQIYRTSLGQTLLLGRTQDAGAYLRAQVGLGFVGSAVAAVIAAFLFGNVWAGVVTFAAALLAFIQDGLRHTQAQSGAWMRGAISDLTMLAAVATAAAIAIAADMSDAFFMMSSWGLGALAGVLVLIPWMPKFRGASGTKWMRTEKSTLIPLAAESGVFLFWLYLSSWVIAGLASVAVLGVYRAAQVCMNPIGTIGVAVTILILSPNGIGGHRMQSGRRGAYCVYAAFACALVLAVGLWTGLLYLGVGVFLFGETWVAVAPICVLVAAGQALSMVSLVAYTTIKRLLGPGWTLRLWLLVSWMEPLLIGVATLTISVIGPMVGWAAFQAIVCAATVPTMMRAIARRFMHPPG